MGTRGKHVAIAGNMGVGKSTLTRGLADYLGATPMFESVDDHPYLDRYYADMKRWAFQSQFFFLSQAFRQHTVIAASDANFVQDRSIYEHFEVFARSLHRQSLLDADDFRVLGDHYDAIASVVPGPDLMIYLTASLPTLQRRIASRGRDCEETVGDGYLAALESHYETWMQSYTASPVLVIDTDEVNLCNAADRATIFALVADELALHRDPVADATIAAA